jgi:hypothetical protein
LVISSVLTVEPLKECVVVGLKPLYADKDIALLRHQRGD